MPSKNNKLFSFLFYALLIALSLFFLVRLISIGITEGIIVVPAIAIAIIALRKMFKKYGGNTWKILFNRKSLSIIFMAIPVLISFQTFVDGIEKSFWFVRWTEYVSFSISPSLVSTLAAIMLYLSIVIRYRRRLFTDAYETVIICLNILFCASFLEIFCGKEIWPIPFINVSSQSFLLFAVILSWIGMRAIAGFVWIFLFILAVTRIAGLNIAMGYLGMVYILSAFVSMGLQMKDTLMISSFKNDFIGLTNKVGEDMVSSTNVVKKLT